MAVSNIQEREFIDGEFNQEEFSYTVLYQCTTDRNDGPDVVRRDPFFRIGKTYSFGNDSNPAARLESVRPKLQSKDNRSQWLVTCMFSTKQEETEPDDPNRPSSTDQPQTPGDFEYDSLELRFTRESELMTRAKWITTGIQDNDGYREGIFDRLGDKLSAYTGVPLNSALQPIEPQPMRSRTLTVFRSNVKVSAGTWLDDISALVGKINREPYEIKSPASVWKKTFPKHTLLLDDVSHQPINAENQGWVMFTLDFVYDPRGHYLFAPDIGTAVTNDREEPETLGTDSGRLPYDHAIADNLETIRDETGAALAQPVKLDGKGGILLATNPSTIIQKYLEDVDIEGDFGELPDLGA